MPTLPVYCYATVRKHPYYSRNRLNLRKNVTRLQPFPAEEPLASVFIDILCPFVCMLWKKDHLLFITDSFSKITKAIPIKRLSASYFGKHVVCSCVFNYGPPSGTGSWKWRMVHVKAIPGRLSYNAHQEKLYDDLSLPNEWAVQNIQPNHSDSNANVCSQPPWCL